MTDPTPEALCHCGHTRRRHLEPPGTPVCMDCPGDEDRAWRHPFKAAPTAAPASVAGGGVLRDAIAEAAKAVQLRIGPNALGMAQRGEPIRLSGNERDAVADAVVPVVHAHYAAQADHLAEHDHAETGALQRQLAEAQAAIERVEQVADWCRRNYPGLDIDHRIQAALNPKDPT